MFYVSVIVPMKIEKILTYHCERKTDVGTLVVVEVLRKNYVGIVESITEEKPNFNTKPVVKILKENCYSEAFIKTVKWMSEYYFCPLGLVLKNFFPTFLNPDYLPQANFSNENTKYITSNYTENINLLSIK